MVDASVGGFRPAQVSALEADAAPVSDPLHMPAAVLEYAEREFPSTDSLTTKMPNTITAQSVANPDLVTHSLTLDPAGELREAVRLRLVRAAKRTLDITVSAVLLVALAPVLMVLALLVRLDSPGPSFFRCERVGYRGRPLRMVKFRKMLCGATGAPLTKAGDERFTRLGPWLAKYKLDELPQLWHVLRGEMSLVGPRPESPDFATRYPDDYYRILSVKPGMVGLSQIAFAEETRVLDPDEPVDHYLDVLLPQKIRLDTMYAAGLSIWLDVRILFWTFVTVVLRKPVAVHRESGLMNIRRR